MKTALGRRTGWAIAASVLAHLAVCVIMLLQKPILPPPQDFSGPPEAIIPVLIMPKTPPAAAGQKAQAPQIRLHRRPGCIAAVGIDPRGDVDGQDRGAGGQRRRVVGATEPGAVRGVNDQVARRERVPRPEVGRIDHAHARARQRFLDELANAVVVRVPAGPCGRPGCTTCAPTRPLRPEERPS